ncbi:MAG: DUF488 domain-containing protein [Desulfobulbus sp.]|jgi:uncharacterized protein YeaO (DUF488 family)|nr:DUF488 domain-containing protein [Desulfobulbus sp.]
MIQLKRIYDPPDPDDGIRILVDRLWPRGVKKENLHMDEWIREVAPSDALRRWFAHDPAKWDEFRRRYSSELEENPDSWHPIFKAAQRTTITLLYSSHSHEQNNAVALKSFLEKRLEGKVSEA